MKVHQQFINRITLIDEPTWRISILDSGPDGTITRVSDRQLSLHVLWARDDAAASINLAGRAVAIAPGDTMMLPAGLEWSATPGMILCEIAGSVSDRAGDGMSLIAPTHGEEMFHGYNRQTVYPAPRGLAIERWKITQPLDLPESATTFAIIDLITPLAMIWSGGTDLIGRGECRIIPPRTGPITLLPDGLGYALLVRRDDEHIGE